jgi:hypothetical protein
MKMTNRQMMIITVKKKLMRPGTKVAFTSICGK